MLLAHFLPDREESPLADLERFAFDTQMRLLRAYHPRALADDIVLVGIDPDTKDAFTEPLALWHRRFGELAMALARGRPRAVGIDVVPPERSYDDITPGLDLAMMRGLLSLSRTAPLVFVQTVNVRGEIVPVQPNYRGILKEANLGVDQQWKDPDGVARIFSEHRLSANDHAVPTLAGQLLRALGRPVGEGYIDYSVGGLVRYVPMHQVASMSQEALERTFGNRIVIVGNLTKDVDRWTLPVLLLEHDPEPQAGSLVYNQPGVLTHAQVVRSHLARGLIQPLEPTLTWLLAAVFALSVLVHVRARLVLVLVAAVPVALLAASLLAIVSWQLLLPLATLVACFTLGLGARALFDAIEAVVERIRLQQAFAGQVSPAVMAEMLGGGLSPGVSGQLADVCVLFSDVRDFTTLSEHLSPERVTSLLQRYFDRMVKPVHRFDGTVDKFIGDGMMVLFGAPRKSADPCGDAVQCALAMMDELDKLNREFSRENLPTLTIGIGINYGRVTVGNIGSSERHNYSAIGDAVNVAARVEGLTKELGRKIIITEAVVSRIESQRFNFDPLGSHKVKGHSPVEVWGIRTARVAPAAIEAEAAT